MLNEVKHLTGRSHLPRFFAEAQNDIFSGLLLHHTSKEAKILWRWCEVWSWFLSQARG